MAGALSQGGDDQEDVGKHGERGPAVPGAPAADLMLVQAAQALASLEGLSTRQRRPATLTKTASGVGPGV